MSQESCDSDLPALEEVAISEETPSEDRLGGASGMADNGNNEGATPVAALDAEGSEIPEAPPKKNQKPTEPPVTFREFDVSWYIYIQDPSSMFP